MKWNNLKEYCCPKCGFQLYNNNLTHDCNNCDFQISDMRFNELVNEIYKPIMDGEEEDNTSKLYDES